MVWERRGRQPERTSSEEKGGPPRRKISYNKSSFNSNIVFSDRYYIKIICFYFKKKYQMCCDKYKIMKLAYWGELNLVVSSSFPAGL